MDTYKKTEELLRDYFKKMRVLFIWRESAKRSEQYIERIIKKINADDEALFFHDVKSPLLSAAVPTNRQPAKGIDASLEDPDTRFDRLLQELQSTMFNLQVTKDKIDKLEQETEEITDILNLLREEDRKVLKLKLDDGKSFEQISDRILKHSSTIHKNYRNTIKAISDWMKYIL